MTTMAGSARGLRAPTAALAAGFLLACSDGGTSPGHAPAPERVQVVSRDPQPGAAGQRLPDSVAVRVLGAGGAGLAGVAVRFSAAAGRIHTVRSTDAQGYARTPWWLGPAPGEQTALARVDGLEPVPLRARAVAVPPAVAPMLGELGDYIASTRQGLLRDLPRNPHSTASFEAKIALLSQPGLAGDIVEGGRFADARLPTPHGRVIPAGVVFPVEGFRAEASQVLAVAERALPVVERFLGLPYPTDFLHVWYGFAVGSAGGAGSLHMEDRTLYESRTGNARFPYDAAVVHEISHGYIRHEGLTQFLELYGYNSMVTGSDDPREWVFTRGYTPGLPSNAGVHALVDVYRLIGPEAMAAAYRAAIPLRPAYDAPLSGPIQQLFVDAAPPAAKAQVADAMARVGR